MNIEIEDYETAALKFAIQSRLEKFDDLVSASPIVEIAGHFLPGDTIPLDTIKGSNGENMNSMTCKEECWKIVNSKLESAVLVSVDSIIKTDEHDLPTTIEALESGITMKVFGVTRIVGYYSRVTNWNSSKTAELADRRKGNYWESRRINTEKVAMVGE